MSEAKHTPGPWEAEYGEAISVLDAERGRVCTINWLKGPHGAFGRKPDAEGEANARLIAAAPDLLAMLKAARLMLEQYVCDATGEHFNSPPINAAIVKAEGHSS